MYIVDFTHIDDKKEIKNVQTTKETISIEFKGSGNVTLEFSLMGDAYVTNENVETVAMPCRIDICKIPTDTMIKATTDGTFERIIFNI